ncbi:MULTISPECIES: glutamate racemase [Escherichia]|nr:MULTISPECIES: glutamate racemase [Escherichia]EHY2528359.1 glutamate racemase [Escherichia coli]EJE7028623.1 glutamate racemase [Escherichia coli]ELB3074300.1 glutamate racemase [Escherichia coli]ELV0966763.1 glutamate racemase [Escherichia coli]HBC1645851.1 glutamate racemase [Escherichia coli]
MKENLIGMFDSGLGGLSVLKALMAMVPDVPAVFVADQRYCPYGTLSDALILNRSLAICDWLTAQGATQIVVACNTATSVAIESLRAHCSVPVTGIEPAIKPAAARTVSGKIAVLATAATLRTERYHSLTDRYGRSVTLHAVTPEGWVEVVENNLTEDNTRRRCVARVLQPLLEEGVDQLVLGCTHYPFLRPFIEELVPAGVEIHDPAPAVISRAASLMNQPAALTVPEGGKYRFCTTGSASEMQKALRRLLGLNGVVQNLSDLTTQSNSLPGRLTSAIS